MDRILLCKHCKFSDGDNEFFLKHCFCWRTLLVKLEDHGQVKVHDNTIKKFPISAVCMRTGIRLIHQCTAANIHEIST